MARVERRKGALRVWLAAIRGIVLLALCFVPMAVATAQTASVRYFGQTCGRPAPYGSPTIGATLPRIGTTWGVQVLGMRGVLEPNSCEHGGFAHLVIGTSNSQWNGLGLPALLPLTLTDGLPCFAQVSLDAILLQGGVGRAGAQFVGSIPNDVSLLGGRVFAQWYVNYWTLWGISCSVYFTPHWVTSDAVELTIGV